jgi:hypothetical protein
VAEAAKVIENTQRDLNIALVNELALIFKRIGIDTLDVLNAAGTKWNFLPFRPGLVGGHCIGVDPYYLTARLHASPTARSSAGSRAAWNGVRARGNRYIIGDPRRADMKDILNQKIKRRESFRPFAPLDPP